MSISSNLASVRFAPLNEVPTAFLISRKTPDKDTNANQRYTKNSTLKQIPQNNFWVLRKALAVALNKNAAP